MMTLPKSMSRLVNLQRLDIGNNDFTELVRTHLLLQSRSHFLIYLFFITNFFITNKKYKYFLFSLYVYPESTEEYSINRPKNKQACKLYV